MRMNDSRIFWKGWPKDTQILYVLLLLLLGLGLLSMAWILAYRLDWVLSWSAEKSLEPIKHTLNHLHFGIFQIPVEGELFLIKEKFTASALEMQPSLYQIYAIFVAFCMVIFVSVLPSLRSLWYGIGMTIFIFFLTYINLDYLQVLPYPKTLLLICLLSYLGLSFYFHNFKRSLGLGWRILAFSILTLGLSIWIGQKSPWAYPSVFLLAYGGYFLVALTLLFISLTAHDILYSFLRLILKYNAEGGKGNLIHFSVFTVFYLFNLITIYLKQTAYVDWDIYTIPVYVLFIISTVLGIWGFRDRQVLFNFMMPFRTQGALIYATLGLLSLTTMGFHLLQGNDATTDVFHDFILYSYVGFGVSFYFYILFNFTPLLAEKRDILPVIYEGKSFPYGILRYFGLIILFAFFIQGNQILYYQMAGGYYNGLGDAYLIHRDYHLAKVNYQFAQASDRLSHRANYSLATLARLEEDNAVEVYHLKTGSRRQPSPQSFIRISNLLLAKEKTFDALFELRKGLDKFPNSLEINNNLALIYQQQEISDSAFYYLDRADAYAGSSPIAQNNLWAYLAQALDEVPSLDSLPPIKASQENLAGWVNRLALHSKGRDTLRLGQYPSPSEQPLPLHFAFSYNYAVNQMGYLDSLALEQLRIFAQRDSVGQFSYRLDLIEACYYYYGGAINEGIQRLTVNPQLREQPYLNTLLGLWLMEQGAYRSAITYLDNAIDLGNELAEFYKALAMTENRDFKNAFSLWQSLYEKADKFPDDAPLIERMLRILPDEVDIQDDMDRYNLIHYKAYLLPAEVLVQIYNEINTPLYQMKAAPDVMLYLIRNGELTEATKIFDRVRPLLNQADEFTQSNNHRAYLYLLNARQEYELLLKEIDQLALLPLHQRTLLYVQANAHEGLQQNAQAEKLYEKALQMAPIDEGGVIKAASFFQGKLNNLDKAYNALVNAVRLNPYSLLVYEQYALVALAMGFDNYAEYALEQIKALSDEPYYQEFVKVYEEQKKRLEKQEE